MKLVIAEKPMLARDIARAITGKKVSETAKLPINGNGYTIIGCAGHLLELKNPEQINKKWGKPWNIETLPIHIPNWPKQPSKDKEKLIQTIADLLQQADSVIHAGDPDDEGQLIIDELLDYLNYQGKVERVYINDNIEKNIRKAFTQLTDNTTCRPAGNAAYARQIADICFGINETRLATKRLGTLLTVGRVQTPTLGLVINRDQAILNHTTQKYYELHATGTTETTPNPITFQFKPNKELLAGEKHLFDKETLTQIANQIQGQTHPFQTTITEKTITPPLPYNLTILQTDMNKRYKFSASKTQQITQDLRDKYKAITYNRSDSQYLKEEHHTEAETVLTQALQNIGTTWPLDYTLHSKAFNDKNVTAHHAIIPQEINIPIQKMAKDEQKVYTAIVERYAMQFLPPAIYKISTSTITLNNGECTYTAKQIKHAGYKAIFTNINEDTENETKNPWIHEGTHTLHNIQCAIKEKETQPPKPYTEGTLIADMASIAKYVKDPKIKEILKQKDDGKKGEHGGIGTTATRATIIENLKKRGYLTENNGKITSTPKAKQFYQLLPDTIKGADTTATWWLIQQDIANGKADINAIQSNVIQIFNQHKNTAYTSGQTITQDQTIGTCPQCGKPIIKKGKTYTCTSNKNQKQPDGTWKQTQGCGFKILPFCQKTFTPTQAKQLLQGKTIQLTNCKSKQGKTFNCTIKLNNDGTLTPTFHHTQNRKEKAQSKQAR